MRDNSYYQGTDFTTMHPMHWEFWYHMLIPWTWQNWMWVAMLLVVIIAKLEVAR